MNVLDQAEGNGWSIVNGDCVDVAASLPDDSVDYIVFSPPFASLYTYSNSARDIGNVRDDSEFAEHFAHLLPNLLRILRPGRLMSIHCMLLPTSKTRDGHIGIRDFRGDLIRAAERAGFIFHSEVTIWKNPVTAVQRTKALGLLHKTIVKDSAMSRPGINDYLVTFRKPGENTKPIAHKHGPKCRRGECEPACEFPVERWQRYASPVWATVDSIDDENMVKFRDPRAGDTEHESSGIDHTETLQYMAARDNDDERHICPLQLGIIRRAVKLWSNPDDVVFSPFMGIASEGYEAVRLGRKFIGAELKASYFRLAKANMARAEPDAKGRNLELFK